MTTETTKKILIINGHPGDKSLCSAIAESYAKGASDNGFKTWLLPLSTLSFDLNLSSGYDNNETLEPDIIRAQKLILESDHIVIVYPNWWSALPALLKGFIDRVFLPGFAFRYRKNSPFPEKLLKGKSARIIVTMDSPVWYFRIFRGSPGLSGLKKGVLDYCGFKPVRQTLIGTVRRKSPNQTQKTLEMVYSLGARGF